jgi:hypothetical protein
MVIPQQSSDLDSILNRFVEGWDGFTFDLKPNPVGLPRKNSKHKGAV